jgi:hypothetical protein
MVTRYVVKLCLKVPFFVVVVVHRPFVCASLDAVVCTYTTVFSPFRECRRVYFNSFLLVRVSGKNRKKIFLRARETKFFFLPKLRLGSVYFKEDSRIYESRNKKKEK